MKTARRASTSCGGVGCGRCIGACNFDAVYAANDAANDELNCKNGRVRQAVVDGRPAFYINIMNQVSPYCDCHGENEPPFSRMVGMFASSTLLLWTWPVPRHVTPCP